MLSKPDFDSERVHKEGVIFFYVGRLMTRGSRYFKNTLWLMVLGKRRREIGLSRGYEAYLQRFDLEHFFRFGKNKLLLDRYQTPEVEHEENWWELVCLAYTQLWLAALLAATSPRPWERYLPALKHRAIPGPAQVQREVGVHFSVSQSWSSSRRSMPSTRCLRLRSSSRSEADRARRLAKDCSTTPKRSSSRLIPSRVSLRSAVTSPRS
jgi:hypothetical protein